MKNSLNRLGVLLMGILMLLLISSATLFVQISNSNYYIMGFGVILLGLFVIFSGYLLYDLISSIREDNKRDRQMPKKRTT